MSTKEAREKEAKKLKYRKMGFGPMMDSGEIDFGDGKKSSKKSFEHPMAEERFQQTAKARLKKSGLEDSEIGDPRTDIKDYDKKEQVYHSRDGNPYLKSKVGEKIHKAAQKQKQEAYAPKSPRNEKMAKGGLHQGYGAARTSGMGLQDESIQPGKVQKAFLGKAIKKVAGIFGGKKSATMTAGGSGGSLPSVTDLYQKALDDARMIKGNKTGGVMKYKRGSGLDLPVINSVKPAVHKTKRAQNLSKYKIQFTKQKNRAGAYAKAMGLPKPLMTSEKFKNFTKTIGVLPNSHFDKKNANVVKHTRVGDPSEFVKRRMKLAGATSGSPSEFVKRRKELGAVGKALSATRVGKIALGVGAAGVAAQQYLKSKMKKDEPEKKMGGGMMKPKVQKAGLGLMFMKKAKDKGAQGAEFLSPMAMLKRVQGNKTGGVMKANEGEFIKRRKALRGVNPFSKTADGIHNAYAKKMGLPKPLMTSEKFKNFTKTIGELPKVKHPFEKKGADKFTKLKTLGRVVGSSRVGKIALGIGAVGLGAKKYLESKMKKNEPEKKMGGGMMKKYSEGMTDKTFTDPKTAMIAHSIKSNDKITKRDREAAKILERKAPPGAYSSIMNKERETMLAYAKAKAFKNKGTRLTDKDIETVKSLIKNPRPGTLPKRFVGRNIGGMTMMQQPIGFKSGTMVQARGCKLGRTRPTKIT
jgi:hypothetical protein